MELMASPENICPSVRRLPPFSDRFAGDSVGLEAALIELQYGRWVHRYRSPCPSHVTDRLCEMPAS
jgi:hypothetical protein